MKISNCIFHTHSVNMCQLQKTSPVFSLGDCNSLCLEGKHILWAGTCPIDRVKDMVLECANPCLKGTHTSWAGTRRIDRQGHGIKMRKPTSHQEILFPQSIPQVLQENKKTLGWPTEMTSGGFQTKIHRGVLRNLSCKDIANQIYLWTAWSGPYKLNRERFARTKIFK